MAAAKPAVIRRARSSARALRSASTARAVSSAQGQFGGTQPLLDAGLVIGQSVNHDPRAVE